MSLILTWSENCVITSMEKRVVINTRKDVFPTGPIFKIKDTKLYVPVDLLSTKDDNNFLEQLKSGFKRTIKWNKYISEMTTPPKTNYLNYLIDQHLIKSIDYLFYRSKIKKMKHFFQSILYQKLK